MRRLLLPLLVLVALAALSLPGLSAQDEGGLSVLQVVDTEPFQGEELSLQEPITVYFDRAINCDTAPNAVTVTPAVQGGLVCGENQTSLIFTPSEAYTRDTEYTLEIGAALTGQDDSQLLEPATLKFRTVGFLQVSEVFPADGTLDIESDAVITVIFNRPVVPLLTVEEMDTLPTPITISPSIEGEGEWLNTSIYVFRPSQAFAGGTQYTVTVNADLEAVDGSVLQEPFRWSFRTVFPEIIELLPRSQDGDVSLEPTIQVRFNQGMNRESAEANFYLKDRAGRTYAGEFTWADDNAGFSFKASERLELDTLYLAGFNSGKVYEQTLNATLTGVVEWSFATVPLPAIVSSDPRNGANGVSPYGGFTIYFASPMDRETFKDKITINPKPRIEPSLYYYDYGDSLSVSFPPEPSTTYTITIAPGMADPYGNTIDTPFTFSYTTGGYSPDLMMQIPGPVGFYNALREKTQLFITHLNVSRVDLELYEVPLLNFIRRAVSDDYYYDPAYDYNPNSTDLLRSWTIPNVAPENVMRYELLTLGGESADCPSSPPARVKVGDTAIVTTEPDPVRARETPPEGEIVELLYKGYSIPIVGGPVCANDIRWWEVELRDQRRGWVAEGIGEEYLIDVRIAADVTQVDVTATDGGQLAPGIYYLSVSAPETARNGYRPLRHMLVVATANLAVKYSIDSITVWATDVQTGESIANAPLLVYGSNSQVLAQGTTDSDGVARIDINRVSDLYVPRAVVLQNGDQFGLSITEWTDGIEPWQFGQNYNFFPQRYRVYMYTDRPLYRPGQPVYFKGIARLKDDVTYTPAELDTVPVKIYNDQGEVIYEKDLPLTPFGSFSDTFTLDDDAGLGYYSVSVELPSEHEYQTEGGSVGFTVGEYRVPEFQVSATPVEDEVVQGDTVQVTVDSTYFFGGPVSNANVTYNVISAPYWFDFTGKGYYDFIDYNYDSGPGEFYGSSQGVVASGSGTTDSRGMFTIEVPASLEDATQSQTFTVEATISDESQQAISGRTSVVVHQGLVYIGARPTKWVGVAGQEKSFDIIAVDWDSNPVANQSIDVEVVERRWSSIQEEDEFGRTTWTWEVEEIPVTEGDVQTDSEGKAQFVFTPPKGGVFKLIITTRDANGNEIRSSTTTWISSREYVSWRQQNSNRIDLIAGQTEFTVGDTAEILIASPFQGTAEAWITVERGDVMVSERVTMDSNSYIYRIPITPEMAPNVFVSVLIVKGVDENNPVAAFRMGIIQLSVDTAQKVMNVEITPDRERAGPRETVTYTVHTTDYKGDPVQAEVGVGLTDLAVLSILGPNSGPLLPFFYGEQGLGIRTATPLTINTDQITQTTLDTIKGGGGGFGAFGITEIRENFIDTPYWNASLVTDANGEATFEVTLPDQLTTWRLDARAITNGEDGVMLVGQNTVDLLSTKPVLIRPVTPRFFVVGDKLVLAAVVNNNSGEALSVDVALQATGITIDGDVTQTVVIESDARARIVWDVTVEDVANVDLTFFASANQGQFTDASKPPAGQPPDRLIPVYKYEVPETVGTAGVLRQVGSRTEAIVLPRRFDVTQGELTINLQPSLAATTIDGLDYLRNYPYQCTEQTVSRFLPNIMTFRALDSLGVENADLEANLNTAVQFAIQRLYAGQHVDGGWGWFVQDRSNPTTTAYALIGLVEARNAGFAVDGGVIQRAQGFLRTTFIVPSLSEPRYRLNRQVFVLYALARSGDPDIARSVTMFEERERLSLYSKAFLALTFSIINPDDTSRSDVLLSDLINAAAVSATGVHWSEDYTDWWNWNTDTRTTAIALDALVKLRPNSDLIPNVVRYLMVQRRADAWETTQETAWALMSLTDWMVVSGELKPDYQFNASLNGEELAEASATTENVRDTEKLVVEVSELLKDQANMLEIARTDGPGVLYYTAHLRAFLPVPEIEPLNRGVIIERRYTLLNGDSNQPITEAHIGDVVQVRLTVIAPNSLHYVVIEDPLPAGAEAIDPKLNISQQIGTRPTLDRTNPLSRGWGWWYFSNIEFRDEKVVLYSTFLPAGTYEYVYTMRPGLEGTYNVIPAVGYEFYFPEVYGRSAGMTFTVLPSE